MDGCDADLVIRILDDDREKSAAFRDDMRHALYHFRVIAAERQGVVHRLDSTMLRPVTLPARSSPR